MSLLAPELEGSEKIVIVVILLCLYVMGLISAIDLKQDLKTKAVEIEAEIKKYTEKMETGEEKNKKEDVEKIVENELVKQKKVELVVKKDCRETEEKYICEVEALKEQKLVYYFVEVQKSDDVASIYEYKK